MADGFVAAPVRRRRRAGALRRDAVLDAGLAVFSTLGLHGASLDQIAERAGLSKTNLLYYFASKEALYVAVLRRVLDVWLDPLQALDSGSEPAEALKAYIRAKVTLSRDAPQASRLFCLEIVQGAPLLRAELEGPLRALVDAKVAVLSGWMDEGRIQPHDPHHLVFSVWAITQHYADFAVQVDAITGHDLSDEAFFERTVASTQRLILAGLGLA
ncbi:MULTISPECIES: HTH-type transcriptional regulator RutR [unclassified Methylobacterium]|uniref:HTH-type transcriptional regulator RutR n=1 Tax=unclassified Methylobacterium TaxID=2615210 RepID=UPI0006F9DB5A|nr:MULTISPECIES: HTH-type transcriptional regulator RutR [unclassified Methylobacterium]KQP34904.1 transcriptional regulator [Methylobacterium sp. Leaf100]KQP68846.1 transcriptional regulator [Methylobacterium sp. Leaf112]